MKAHAKLKKLLSGKNIQAFVKDICLHAYPYTEKIPSQYLEYKIFEEFRLRESTGEKTRLGLDKKLQVIPDVIFFIKPGYRALNQGHCFTVALEIKEFKDDLLRDEKLWRYVGWTDFFFIAVPDDLVEYAFEKIVEVNKKHPETQSMIGVLGIETGELYSHPKRSEVTIDRQNLVLQNAVYNYAFKDAQTVIFSPEEHTTTSSVDVASSKNEKNENVSQQNNMQQNCMLKMEDKQQLSAEERAARKAAAVARQEYRERRATELAEKSIVLNEDVRQRLMAQSQKAQEVFWKIRESDAGKQLQEIVSELGCSQRTAAYALSSLSSAGLAKRDGSRKTGAYVVTDVAACNTTCATCSIALQCKDYKPV